MTEKLIPLLRIGSDQVVEIPPEFEMACDEVTIRQEGDRLILEPVHSSAIEHP